MGRKINSEKLGRLYCGKKTGSGEGSQIPGMTIRAGSGTGR